MPFKKVKPGPGQESVWDYPRPPRLEEVTKSIRIEIGDVTLVDSRSAMRVLETSHPPVYYIPISDVRMEFLKPTEKSSWCEWKGRAQYFDIVIEDRRIADAAWAYLAPTSAFESIRGHLAFYPHLMDACFVGDEQVRSQAGGFYGGWITSDIVGPFKGEPGTMGW